MSFLSSIYLWLIPLIAIPLIFHLLKKRKFNTVYFSSLKFFLKIEEESLKKVNFVNILLLLIRTLIILLLILIFSNPIINAISRNNTSNESTILKILIDNSFSNNKFLKNDMNTVLKDIFSNYPDNTFISVETFNNQYIYNDLIQNIKFPIRNDVSTFGSYEISNVIKNIDNDDYNEYMNKDLFIISDFQKNIFNDANTNNLKEFSKEWNVFLFNHGIHRNEVALSNFKLLNRNVSINDLLNIEIKCTNSTNQILENQIIELYVDNTKVGDNTITFKPNDSHILSFKTSIPDFGSHKCYITINNNYYYFTIDLHENLSAGLMYDNYDDAKYISNVLNAYNELNNNLSIDKITDSLSNLNNNTFDFIFKFGTEDLSEQFLYKIKNITNNLIVIPLNTLYLNNLFTNEEMILNKEYLNETYTSLDDTFIKDIYLRELFEKYSNNYKIFHYFDIPSNKNTILSLKNNKALLNQYTINDMNVFLFTVSMDLESSNIPVSSTFIPLLEFLIFDNNTNSNRYIDDYIKFKRINSNDTITHILNNKVSKQYKSSYFFKNNIHFDLPGFHTFKFNQTDSLNIAINVKDNEIIDEYENQEGINTYFYKPIYISNLDDIDNIISTQISGKYIWRYLLYVLTLLVIVEMYISNIYIYKND